MHWCDSKTRRAWLDNKMATRETSHLILPSRTLYNIIFIVTLQFLMKFAQGAGPGASDGSAVFELREELPVSSPVGTIPIRTNFTYHIYGDSPYFALDGVTGNLTTKQVIDREALNRNNIDILILSRPQVYPIDVTVIIVDINDNPPSFPNPIIQISFPEDSRIETQNIVGTATDADKNVKTNGNITSYHIVSGNEDNKFKVVYDPYTLGPYLYIATVAALDREDKDYYQLNISAADGGTPTLFGYALINITILDRNDNQPSFPQSEYVATINESVPIGSTVIRVEAKDLDIGDNGIISYSLEPSDQFHIDEYTGVITTTRKLVCHRFCGRTLDCQPNSCFLTILATDHGVPSLTERAYVTVNLLDENDHAPEITFRHYPDATKGYSTVNESAEDGHIVAVVSIQDRDEGLNGQTTLQIISGNERGHFGLKSQSGFQLITVAGRLDRERIHMYNLSIEATDKGSPPKSSSAFLIIYINDVNDHNPEFQYASYSCTLSELSPIGSYVSSITAIDRDTGINSFITYSIQSGNTNNWFAINERSGLVTVNTQIDYERQTSLVLNISAHDGGLIPRFNFTTLTIDIQDENDIVPTFDRPSFNVNILEGNSQLTQQFLASDSDGGINGTIRYEFYTNVDTLYPSTFQLNTATGEITVLKALDREKIASYQLLLIARDGGSPSLSSTATIYFNVQDVNDNNPVFYPQRFYAEAVENQPSPSRIIQVKATDKDIGSNAQLKYTFDGLYPRFLLDRSTGWISTSVPLDRKQEQHYQIKVLVQDNGTPILSASSSAIVEISVADANDEVPQFTMTSYIFSIIEDAFSAAPTRDRSVGTVTATSRDANPNIAYHIVGGDPHEIFSINRVSGSIVTNSNVDREEQALYTLMVVAKSGSRMNQTTVEIEVNDINDNRPTFDVPSTQGTVLENWPVGHGVFHAKTLDSDAGDNGAVSYTLKSGTDQFNIFEIHEETGMIYLAKPTKFAAQQTTFNLIVLATDAGSPQLSSELSVTLTIEDVNDHSPVFESRNYEISLSEATSVNEMFFTLTATDLDIGKNAQIIYNISRGNEERHFGIFPNGVIYVGQKLDREAKDLYMFTVVAIDLGDPARSSQANVTIHILDANDNEPLFSNATYDLYVKENQPSGMYIGMVVASDVDIGRNGELSYSIAVDQNNFTVDMLTGEVTTLKPFDREYLVDTEGREFYSFEVVSSDMGVESLKTNAIIRVHILDINDNKPVFTRTSYSAHVLEDAYQTSQVSVVKISATDRDAAENGHVTYLISEGNEDNKFAINEITGMIQVVGQLDRETRDNYNLKVVATDSGKVQQLSAITDVSISITDSNDNHPIFLPHIIETSISESQLPGMSITTFSATDGDIGNNAAVAFVISNSDPKQHFHIDTATGSLYLDKALNFESTSDYRLNITATDYGVPALSTSTIFTVHVLDANDNAPQFDTPGFIHLREGANLNDVVTKLRAHDIDSGVNAMIIFGILSQEPGSHTFGIHKESGDIFVNGVIDREFSPTFNITVIATDQAMPSSTQKSTLHSITIIIDDVNDNAPKITSMNALTVPRSTPSGTLVGTITAKDLDGGDNGQVLFGLSGGDTNMFTIESTTGKIFLSSTLTSSAVSYSLTITATDGGRSDPLGKKSSSMDVKIIVLSGGNNGPTFSNSSYSGKLYEGEPEGHDVLTVRATHINSIEYYVTSITTGATVQPTYFQINKDTGHLTTTEKLDSEKGFGSYDIEIIAMDTNGGSAKTTSVMAHVELLDKNDTPPRFSSALYQSIVPENEAVGGLIARVAVSDPDTVGQVSLSFIDDYGTFQIDNSGTITTTQSLNREKRSDYRLHVLASDGEQTTDALVTVKVSDVNDNSPRFSKSIYSFDVPENTPLGTIVDSIRAIDDDEGANGHVTYGQLSDWGKQIFHIDPVKGTISVINSLDYEQTQIFILIAFAEDGGSPARTSTATVYMNVKDVNDNTPLFDPMSFSAEIFEGVSIGTSVIQVAATDSDAGVNAQIKYSIDGGNDDEHFTIYENNGTIATLKDLDRETQELYTLIVMATDHALPASSRLFTTAQVTIRLKDVNDCDPVFTTPSVIHVREDRVLNDPVFTIIAVDHDLDDNGRVSYTMTAASGVPFTIRQADGALIVNGPLDRETVSNYTMTITATDHGSSPRSSNQIVQVVLDDVNDNAPRFKSSQPDSITVQEDDSVGKVLLQVTATDNDIGRNGIVRYFIIAGDDNYDFSIDQSSGILRIQKSLDYERKTVYNLVIQAEDSGVTPKSESATVTVTVNDANDNVPSFVDSPYYCYVKENMQPSSVYVTQVSARDDDSEPNRQLRYNIREGDVNIFNIDVDTGVISAHVSLDRESQAEYNLIVIATDSGSPPLTGSGTVTIFVQDENDNTPEFQWLQNTGTVEENVVNGYVTIVQATDKDEGSNAQIRYSLQDSIGNKFSIHPDTGRIFTMAKLDREEENEYNLVVIAMDGGTPTRSTSALVMVLVDDVNDNSPRFENRNYSRLITDPTNRGEFVLGVTAIDRDLGSNGQVLYSLSGSDAGKFSVDTSTGVITASETLQGLSNVYRFNVHASDQGQIPETDDVSVQISFTSGSASQKPTFTSTLRTFNLSESDPIGHPVTTIVANSVRSGTIQYFIAGGNIGQVFSIGVTSGSLSLGWSLDYEMTHTFNLWIEARDIASPTLSQYLSLTINVADVNDNTPRFEQQFYNATISENTGTLILVEKVSANDADVNKNGEISYSIYSGNTHSAFTMNADTGRITTNVNLDRETVSNYSLVVEATDKGSPSRTATATVSITVLDTNDNYPKFTTIFSARVPENIQVDSFIFRATSSDKDIGDNARPLYLLEDASNFFTIGRVSGNVTVIAPLDAEKSRTHRISITAMDGSFSINTPVTIHVEDVNDNEPKFIKTVFDFNFAELQSEKAFVGIVLANDSDVTSPNNRLYYSLKRQSMLFHLDDSSGQITCLQSLSYVHTEDDPSGINRHELIVVATDLGTPSKSSEASVVIHVMGANNNAPVFQKASYFSGVPQNAPLGLSILQVVARDSLDYGINAEVFYEKADGNGINFFSVDNVTGVVSVRASLSHLQNQDLVVMVRSQDKGIPPLSSTVEVRLRITDINSHAPAFQMQNFNREISETAGIDTLVASISATDNDGGLNGDINYFIAEGDPQNLFAIGETDGRLKVAKPLDFDTVPVHHLNITARDRALLYKETSIIYTINLRDFNDNPPIFDYSMFYAYIAENSPRNTFVYRVIATDADSSPNNIINYYIVGNDQASTMFNIDVNDGTITLKGSIDYETQTKYTVYVRAINPSSDLKSTATINVHVTGVNEFYPQFSRHQYSYVISEAAEIGKTIGTVHAEDQDLGEDGVVYYFLIGSSNLMGFKVNPHTGDIWVSGRPDYESSPRITLQVLAKNSGSIHGNDTDTCSIDITIQDANDAPTFLKSVYVESISEGDGIGTPVIQVSAIDGDVRLSDRIFTYTILSGNTNNAFVIDRSSGQMHTNVYLDREKIAQYNITVGAVDTGSPPETGSAVVLITIDDINDNGPIFKTADLSTYISENVAAPASVITLALFTTDPDIQPNQGPYRYQTVLGAHNNYFTIDPNTGLVETKVSLDREANAEFDIPVIVEDGGNPTMSSTLTFRVAVDDVNDEPSKARQMTIKTFLYESRVPSTTIADVKPLDADTVGEYSCHLTGNPSSVFGIPDHCNLHIWSVPNLDEYNLQITGDDGIHPSVSYTASVEFWELHGDIVNKSTVLRISRIHLSTFVQSRYQSLLTFLSNLFTGNYEIAMYSVKQHREDVLVVLAVKHQTTNLYRSANDIAVTIDSVKSQINQDVGITLADTAYRTCSSQPCVNVVACEDWLEIGNDMETANSDHLIISHPTVGFQFRCTCNPSFTGITCDIPVSQCGDLYCLNGGTCENNDCLCPSSWTGPSCEVDVNECLNKPCKNNGNCVNHDGGFKCECFGVFTGKLCDDNGMDDCENEPCQNGGHCEKRNDGTYCQCSYSYWGQSCHLMTFSFEGSSYMQLPTIDEDTNDIRIKFASNRRDSLLLYNPGPTEFIALEIIDGEVQFSFSLGDAEATRLRVPVHVSDGEWYQVEAQRNGKMGYVKVSRCPQDTRTCETCNVGDSNCYRAGAQTNEKLEVRGYPLNVGGVYDIKTVLQGLNQVSTYDFIGCVRELSINGVDVTRSNALQSSGVKDGCPRSGPQNPCAGDICKNDATCHDEWDRVLCSCPASFMGPTCEQDWQPFGFGPNSVVDYQQKESYRREQLLQNAISAGRKRRALPASSVFLRFRMMKTDGVLFYSTSNTKHFVLQVFDSKPSFSIKDEEQVVTLSAANVADGRWHNITVEQIGTSIEVTLEDGKTSTVDYSTSYDFTGLDITSLSLGGMPADVAVQGTSQSGFGGCVSIFMINGESLPLNSTTSRFVAIPRGAVSAGCDALCDGNPCPSGDTCHPAGEVFKCTTIDGGGLSIGVIVVIVFFIMLLIVIIICFILYRYQCFPCAKQKANGTFPKFKISLFSSKNTHDNGARSCQDSGYGGDNPEVPEDVIIGNHIAQAFNTGQSRSSTMAKPDILDADIMGRTLPLEMDDGTVIIENGSMPRGHQPHLENVPEHYDLENASSIAPSDIDVCLHYKDFRDGKVKYKNNLHQNNISDYQKQIHKHLNHHPRESPLTINSQGRGSGLSRESPGLSRAQKQAQGVRKSPVSIGLMSVPARASPMHMNNLARSSPAMKQSPLNELSRKSPNVKSSTMAQNLNMSRNTTPATEMQGSRNNSDRSMASHHSISSSSVGTRPPVVPNGHLGHLRHNGVPGGRAVKGLTLEEIDKLNARPRRSSPVSLLDAVSSTSNGVLHRNIDSDILDSNLLLEPPDSSTSDDSANDSFTCSEYEIENDRGRNEHEPGSMIFSRVPEENENGDSPEDNRTYKFDGFDSNGDSFSTLASSEDDRFRSKKPLNDAFNWDSFLNWGNNFEKLVGVFKDIALLPDDEIAEDTQELDLRNDGEEYV